MKLRNYTSEIINSRHLIYYLTLGFALIFFIYALITPKTYVSKGQVLPQGGMGGIMELSGVMGGMGGQESKMLRIAKAAGLSLGYSSADVTGALLMSRTIMEAVIVDCDLFTIYGIKRTRMESALKHLESLTKVVITREDIVRIQCIGKSPGLAAKMVNSYIHNLDLFLREKSMSKGKNMRIFVEKRLADATIELHVVAESLKSYQEHAKIIVPDEEIKVAIEAYAGLKGQLFAKEVQAEIIDGYSSKNAPYYLESKAEAKALKKKLAGIELQGVLKDGFGVGFGVSFADIPAVMQEYYRRYLEVKIQEEVYGFLKQQYEQARILEVKDTPIITVLDWGKPPERKHSPKILRLVIFGIIIGFMLGLVKCLGTTLLTDLLKNKERKKILMDFRNIFTNDIRSLLRLFASKKRR